MTRGHIAVGIVAVGVAVRAVLAGKVARGRVPVSFQRHSHYLEMAVISFLT